MKIAEHYAKRTTSDDDNMIPLINVVFLMLIFFMVAGQIQKSDPIAFTPPHSINDARATSDPDVIVIAGLDGTFYIDDQLQSIGSVQSYLENQYSSSLNQETFWVQVKADASIAADALRPLFNQIRQAGLTKVSLATQLKQSSEQ